MFCVCKKCGTIFEGRFCPECGTEYGPVRECEGCGASFVGNYCPECGRRFDTGDVTLSSGRTPGSSDGLKYSLQAGGYAVMGIGTCKDRDVVIPAECDGRQVTQIWGFAFQNCRWVLSIKIPDTVTKVSVSAFSDCSSLFSVIFPDSITEIENGTFRNCLSLTCVAIPGKVRNIAPDAFYNCQALAKVFYSGTIADWNRIQVHPSNVSFLRAKKYFFSEKKSIIPSDNLWHYDADGNIEIW